MRKIQNFEKLAFTPLRKAAFEIAEAGLQAIDTKNAVAKGMAKLDLPLDEAGRLFVVGIGKCASQGVMALESALGDKITSGLVLDIQGGAFGKARFLQGDHPFSTERNKEATKEIIDLLKQAAQKDTVLFLISGGGSALLCQPERHTCENEEELMRQLFARGAAIQELNVVRKHLSLARGGWLATYAYPAKIVSLIFSDVPGDSIEVISSGPTVFDSTTKEDAQKVLEGYQAEEYGDFLIETPKDRKYFEHVRNILFISNKTALDAMVQKAEELMFAARVKTAELTGEARNAAKQIVEELHEAPPQSVLLYGGETTVTAKKTGKGGRNLELALSALRFVQKGELVLPLASDGRDNTEYAGGVADTAVKERAAEQNILRKISLFHFLSKPATMFCAGTLVPMFQTLSLQSKNKPEKKMYVRY